MSQQDETTPRHQALRETATAWIDEALEHHGLQRLSPLELARARSWSDVMRLETSAGPAWFKAASESTAFEARLYPLLNRVVPDIVLAPLAIDEARGWMLLPDGGDLLDSEVDVDGLVERLVAVAPRYAQMQRAMSSHVDEMLACGLPDMRLAALPGRFDEVIAYSRTFVSKEGNEGFRDLFNQVETLRDTVEHWASAMEHRVGGTSLDHSDLHARNILVPQEGGVAAAKVYDWGDSIIAHPFTSLLVLLRDLMNTLQAPREDRRVQRVVDAYLEPFSDLAPRGELMDTIMAVCQIGKITRAHAWLRTLPPDPVATDPEDASAPLEWLGELLSPNLLDPD